MKLIFPILSLLSLSHAFPKQTYSVVPRINHHIRARGWIVKRALKLRHFLRENLDVLYL